MSLASAALVAPTMRPMGRVHVLGAGPVGLFLTALLQSIDGQAVRLYERRDAYTRTRMVSLAEFLIADSIESYKADTIDGQSVEAIFDPIELETRLAYRRTLAPDLRALLEAWTQGFVPLNTIERTLSELIDTRATGTVERVMGEVDAAGAIALLEPGDILVDCTGSRSRHARPPRPGRHRPDGPWPEHDPVPARVRAGRHLPVRPALRVRRVLQVLQERRERRLQVHPGRPPHLVRRRDQPRDRHRHHQQGGVRRDAADVRRHVAARATSRASRCRWTGSSTRSRRRPTASWSGDLEITRIPLDVYHARNTTSRRVHGSARSPVGESAGLPPRGLRHRVAVLPVDLARPRMRLLPGRPHRQPGDARSRTCSSGTRRSCTGSGCGSTCGPR